MKEAIMVPKKKARVAGSDEVGETKEISEDLIDVILVRLPVKSLLRFKSVSKPWYSLITSCKFINLQSTRSDRNKKVYLMLESVARKGQETTVLFRFGEVPDKLVIPCGRMANNVRMVGCFNGVVCLSLSHRPQRYAFWNPATRQLRQIDVPNEMAFSGGWSANGFCFDPAANSFNVAHITLTDAAIEGEGETRAHIIQFSSATNSWTQKSIGFPYRISEIGKTTIVCGGVSFVNRYIHWNIAIFHHWKDAEPDDMYILSYDMIGGIFERIELPSRPVHRLVHFANFNGSLAVFVKRLNVSNAEFDVWMMNDFGGANQSWSKLPTCRRPSKVGPGVEYFIENEDESVLMRETEDFPRIKQCYPYSETLATLN